MKKTLGTFVLLATCALFPAATWMDEGMWLLDSVDKLPLAKMKDHGLELTPSQIFNPDGTSLTDAIVLLPGGTGGFISNQGLIITNHHIAFAGIQSLSSVHDDYLKNGFLAKTKEEELSTSYTAEIVTEIRDITTEVLSVVTDGMSAEDRSKAIQKQMRTVEANARGTSDYTYRASELYNGVKFSLFRFEVLRDVRLVYAPPSAIGNYGGEVDNWMWPRHTGDFALMRAYTGPNSKPAKYAKENIPYTPRKFLPVSSKGAIEGTFSMIMGFPGTTYRYREFPAVQLAHDQTMPATIDLYQTRMDVVERIGKDDREIQIKYATKNRRIANAYKKQIGILEGMKRSGFLNLKKKENGEFAAWISSSPERQAKYGSLLKEMDDATKDLQSVSRKNIFYTNFTTAVEVLAIANRFITYTNGFPKDSLGKTLEPTEKERAPVRDFLATTFKDFDLRVDKEMMVQMMLKSAQLPVGQEINSLRRVTANNTGTALERRVRDYVNDLYDDSKLTSKASCEQLLLKDEEDILDDPIVAFMSALAEERAPVTAKVNAFNTAIGRMRTIYTAAWLLWKNLTATYPDANRTLRMTYGLVEPLEPKDAVTYSSMTSLGGIMEKETGEEPFVVPEKLKDLWLHKDFGTYADPKLHDVPVAFIANLDITGGNSGSPVINGRGELIGCSFDGNWEAVLGDYYFQSKYNRATFCSFWISLPVRRIS